MHVLFNKVDRFFKLLILLIFRCLANFTRVQEGFFKIAPKGTSNSGQIATFIINAEFGRQRALIFAYEGIAIGAIVFFLFALATNYNAQAHTANLLALMFLSVALPLAYAAYQFSVAEMYRNISLEMRIHGLSFFDDSDDL
jgi:hypothetical protein